ncbi:MAG: ThuA domain-containing protein [Candidatus Hydrogenedentes bacterium]|nr:ThuA domain-containing protein [Candidatus Hydrogenedentota bacterium]
MKLLYLTAICSGLFACADESPIRLLVITGSHGFDPRFYGLFEGLNEIEWDKKTQTNKPCAAYTREFAKEYDVVLLYDFEMNISEEQKIEFANAFGKGRGLIVLHHALCNHPAWPKYREIAGGQFFFEPRDGHRKSEYTPNVEMTYRPADPNHPITQGVQEIRVVEEPYKYVYRPDTAIPILVSSNGESDDIVAWTTQYKDSRVVVIAPGHGGEIFADENYKRFIAQAIRWAAKRENLK